MIYWMSRMNRQSYRLAIAVLIVVLCSVSETLAQDTPLIFYNQDTLGGVPFAGRTSQDFLKGEGTLPQRFALVIGINEYEPSDDNSPEIHGGIQLPRLNNAESDAQKVADFLENKLGFFTVR